MKIDDRKIADFISRKLGIRTCEACGMNAWTHDPVVYELREWDDTGTASGDYGAVVPLVTLSCSKCGNTKLFNAVTAGLIDDEDDIVP